MKQKYFSLSILIIFIAFNSSAQTNSLASNSEIISERSMYSKAYLKPNGDHEAIISGAPVHYRSNGIWEDINTQVISNSNGFQNESNVIRSYFPNSIGTSNKIKLIVNGTDEIFIHSEKQLVLTDGQPQLILQNLNHENGSANVSGNKISYPDIYPGISDEFEILKGQIKNNVVLSSVPSLLSNVSSGYFGFQETLELPSGWKIINSDNTSNVLTSSALQIVDANNNPILTIPAPIFFDSYGLQQDGVSLVEGKYLVKQENNYWTIATLVPVSWLKNANTQYPVSIDPTVTIPATTGGWQSPNNWVDNPGFVFVGVCCGNLTHRGWMKFSLAGIPTQSCITNVEVQVAMATENSVNPEIVLINDVTGAFGPYGAINAAAYNDFGTGFYTSFTITSLMNYGYYSLGASANTLLQSQIPGGWFQLAFQFNNEPSVDWKNMNATGSNLRVTYTAPPCVVLPIELLSFEGKCEKGKVNLTWETATQTNNDHFTIERTTDGSNYEIIGTVKGAGNSSRPLNYSFVDTRPVKGISYYSLKQTDFNGQTKALKLIAVNCDGVKEITAFPNPSQGTFIVEGAEENSEVVITDVMGQVVFRSKIAGEKTEIDLREHLNGIYFIKMMYENGPATKKIIINK